MEGGALDVEFFLFVFVEERLSLEHHILNQMGVKIVPE